MAGQVKGMRKHFSIKFRTKTFLVYIIIIMLIMLSFAGGSLYYVTQQHWRDYSRSVEYECSSIAADFSAMYDDAEHLTTFLLSDPEILSAIRYLSRDGETQDDAARNKYKKVIRTALYSYYITKYYYRVSYVNPGGILVTSDHNTSDVLKEEKVRERWKANYEIDEKKSLQFLGKYRDVWDSGNSLDVVGFVKRIYGDNKGYFEIQISMDDFADLFRRSFSYDMDLTAVFNGEVVYSGLEDGEMEELGLSDMEDGGSRIAKGRMLTCSEFNISGDRLTLYGVLPLWELAGGIGGIYIGILLLILVLILLTFLFLYFYSKKLVVPINYLKEQMDKTSIENLEELDTFPEGAELEEMIALNRGYNRLICRIRDGRIREKKLEELQMQTSFDALQAQVNPHFINNTLNVISYRGTLLEDEEICEVCNDLSSMLKFSTNTKRRIVTVREELDYVECYMELLKYRHRDKFHYEIQVDRQIYQKMLPKIVIQQLVENSVTHGYRTPYEVMEIKISGWLADGRWYIKVSDNGDGFEEKVLAEIRDEMERIRHQILEEHQIQGMEIGGMGLLNIYSRMLLMHNTNFEMDFYNSEDGAEVVLCSS